MERGTVAYSIYSKLALGTSLAKQLRRAYFPVEYQEESEQPTEVYEPNPIFCVYIDQPTSSFELHT